MPPKEESNIWPPQHTTASSPHHISLPCRPKESTTIAPKSLALQDSNKNNDYQQSLLSPYVKSAKDIALEKRNLSPKARSAKNTLVSWRTVASCCAMADEHVFLLEDFFNSSDDMWGPPPCP